MTVPPPRSTTSSPSPTTSSSDTPSSPPPTLPDFPETPAPQALLPDDAHIAEALTAWLQSLAVIHPPTTFHDVAVSCIPLCTTFTIIAPTLLSSSDFFDNAPTSGPNVSRNFRYNVRRLARALGVYFQLPSTHTTSTTSSPTNSASSDDGPPPSVQHKQQQPHHETNATNPSLEPIRLRPFYANELTALATNQRIDHHNAIQTALLLTECIFAAASSCPTSSHFINPILALPEHIQGALVHSMNRTSTHATGLDNPTRPPLHSSNRPSNEENLPKITAHDATFPAAPAAPDDRLTQPTGIPLSDYKALAAERDSLRRKLGAVDAERSQLLDTETSLLKSLDDATDRVRILESDMSTIELKLAEKSRVHNETIDALREAQDRAEELDILRVKAQSAEELESSLKHASQRLEEMAAIRQVNKDLQAEISAFRESETKMTKHTEYLETQLTRGNQRAEQLNKLADTLSFDIEQKENRVIDLDDENETLKRKLDAVTQQLETAIVASTTSKATTATYSAAPSAATAVREPSPALDVDETVAAATEAAGSDKDGRSANSGTNGTASEAQTTETTTTAAGEDAGVSFDAKAKTHVSDLLLDAIGARVGWEDIVECMRGVMDAMRDMDQSEELEQRGAVANEEFAPPSPGLDRKMGDLLRGISADGIRRTRPSSGSIARPKSSQQSLRSDGQEIRHQSGSDALSRLSFLPEFGELDAKLKARSQGSGDEFDYAANHCNVQEIRVGSVEGGQQSSESDGYRDESSYTADKSGTYEGDISEDNAAVVQQSISQQIEESQSAQEGKSSTSVMTKDEGQKVQSERIRTDGTMKGAHPFDSKLTSKSMMIRGTTSRSTSRSDTTSVIARQTRNDLRELRQTMETMRVERQSSASVSVLAQKLDNARVDVEMMRKKVVESETESANLRREMNLILKEMDALSMEKKVCQESELGLMKEKERLVAHLEESLRVKEEEVRELREKYEACERGREKLRSEEKTVREKLEAALVIERAHEVEIAKLRAQVETRDNMTSRLDTVMERTEGLTSEMNRQRESNMNEALEAAQRDKQLAEEARDEAKQLAQSHANVLEDMRASAAAAAMARAIPLAEERQQQQQGSFRRSSKFLYIWKRLLHRTPIDFSMPPEYTAGTSTAGASMSPGKTPRRDNR